MHRASWEQIEPLFTRLLELPESERRPWLSSQCNGNTHLFEEVWEVYRDAVRDDDFLESPLQACAPPDTGKRIGPYELVSVLGVGGMGTVWLAERVDGQFRQRVALKLVRIGMDTEAVLRRFKTERQLLADLDHPRIARLLDGGTTEDGRPYLVMEYVQGDPLLDYCDEGELGVERRLRLFQKVCAAVQHAHERGVVHRDLKPSNVLVDDRGEPKLLDFGIAKVIESDESSALLEQTLTAERFLSPRYASPEQLRGGPVGVSSDVYALGVLLYELLTDRHPYGHQTTSWREFEEQVFERNPLAPSRAVGAQEPAGQLKGDLDQVALFALRKEPERRYASAAALSADVGRYLDGLPVQAHPDSVRYRVGKFVRRNKRFVTGTSLFVVLLSLALAFSIHSYLDSSRAEREARWLAYVGHVAAAENALQNAHVGVARSYLEQAPAELRSWEWDHLTSRLDRSLRTLPGEFQPVLALDASNGRLAVDQGGQLQLLDAVTLEPVMSLENAQPHSLSDALLFSRDGRRLAVSWPRSGMAVYDTTGTGQLLNHETAVRVCPSLHPDDARLFAGTEDGRAAELELDSGTLLREWQAHDSAVGALALSPDRRWLATGCWEGGVRIWDAADLSLVHELEGHWMAITDLDFTPDGTRLLSSSLDGSARVWNVATGARQALINPDGGFVHSSTFGLETTQVICSTKRGRITSWDTHTGDRLAQWTGHEVVTGGLTLDRKREVAWSIARDGLKEWRLDTQELRTLPASKFAEVVAFDPAGTQVASAGPDQLIRLYGLASDADRLELEGGGKVLSIAFSPDGSKLASVTRQGQVSVWDRVDGRLLRRNESPLEVGGGSEFTLSYTLSGTRILACSDKPWVDVLDASSLERVHRIENPHGGNVMDVALHPDGVRALAAEAGGRTLVLDLVKGVVLAELTPDARSRTHAVAVDPSGAIVASGHGNGEIVLWDLSSLTLMARMSGHSERVDDLAVHPDGHRLASASSDGTVRIWELPTGRAVVTLRGHGSSVSAVAFSPDGETLASCSYDSMVKLWESVPGD